MFKRIISPLLHVTPYVGSVDGGKPVSPDLEGKPWLWNHEYGFSFCVGEIDESFKPLPAGEVVRIEVGVSNFEDSIAYKVRDACKISWLADKMLLAAFGATDYVKLQDIIGEEFYERFCLPSPSFDEGYPDEVVIHYQVVRV
jgi:hypothetical protein